MYIFLLFNKLRKTTDFDSEIVCVQI